MARREREGLNEEARGVKPVVTTPADRYPKGRGLNLWIWLFRFCPVRGLKIEKKLTKKQRVGRPCTPNLLF